MSYCSCIYVLGTWLCAIMIKIGHSSDKLTYMVIPAYWRCGYVFLLIQQTAPCWISKLSNCQELFRLPRSVTQMLFPLLTNYWDHYCSHILSPFPNYQYLPKIANVANFEGKPGPSNPPSTKLGASLHDYANGFDAETISRYGPRKSITNWFPGPIEVLLRYSMV